MVACDEVPCDCVTDELDEDELELLFELDDEPESLFAAFDEFEDVVDPVDWLPVPWLAWVEVLVPVVRPRPTAAPRALTTLSPARPTCTRRLRFMDVMSRHSVGHL